MNPHRLARLAMMLVASSALIALRASPATAETILVDRADDVDGPGCTVREAIRAANLNAPVDYCSGGTPGQDLVVLSGGTYELSKPGTGENSGLTGDLDITEDLVVQGTGAGKTIIDANGIDRVFDVDTGFAGATVLLQDLTITGGSLSSSGGGIWNNGNLTLSRVEIVGNVSLDAVAGGGGGIYNNAPGNLTIVDSVVRDNQTTGSGDGGGMRNGGTATIVRSLFAGNRSRNGGGIINIPTPASVTVHESAFIDNVASGGDGGGFNNNNGSSSSFFNVTFSRNVTTEDGGGLYHFSGTSSVHQSTFAGNRADSDGNGFGEGGGLAANAALGLTGSVFSGNFEGSGGATVDCGGGLMITSMGGNVEPEPNECNLLPLSGDVLGDPLLAPLADNGGPTLTHALGETSPARDLVPAGTCQPTDQRGVSRAGPSCDAGAYELIYCAKVVVNRLGTEAADVIGGTPDADGVLAFGGNDTVTSAGGADAVCAGGGRDSVRGGGGNDLLLGQSGKDKLLGQGGNDLLRGGGANDSLNGGGGHKDVCKPGGGKKDRLTKCEK